MIKLIAFDLDNVLIDGEAIDEIAKLASVEEKIAEITEKAMQGELDFETAIKERVALLKGISIEDINKTVKNIPLMEGAEETVSELKKRGYKIATISGSFEIIANHIKEKLNLDYAVSNILHEENGILTGKVSGPLVNGSKAEVLEELMQKENISTKECAAVGDGANDISMLEEVKLGIAFNAKPVLKEIADVVIEKRDLKELIPLFESNNSDIGKTKSSKPLKKGETFDALLNEKRKHETELSVLTKERDDLNQEAKQCRQLRDDLNNSIKENLAKATEYRDERDKVNEEVKKYKKLRDQANEKLKSVEWASGRRDILKIENEIKKLEKTIETRVLDIRKENELVKKISDLSKKLRGMQEDEKIQKEAIELKELSESYHAKVVEFSESAQSAHEKMIEAFRKIDDIRTKADEAHSKFIETKDEASKKHENVRETLSQIRELNKKLDKIKSRKRSFKKDADMKKNLQEKERAVDIYEKFKGGKKLTNDELLLLQKHNVI